MIAIHSVPMRVHDFQMVTLIGTTQIMPQVLKVDTEWSLLSRKGSDKDELQT